MSARDSRPPRSAPPRNVHQSVNYSDGVPAPELQSPRPRLPGGVSFQDTERGDRQGPLSPPPTNRSRVQQPLPPAPPTADADVDFGERVGRKKSLVRPDREKIEPGHRQWHYRNQAAKLETRGSTRMGLMPSTTGSMPQGGGLRRGKSLLGRDQDVQESGLSLFKRSATLRRKRNNSRSSATGYTPSPYSDTDIRCCGNIAPGPKDAWMLYCYILTACVPPVVLRAFGITTPEAQRAWREKMGLLAFILQLMAGVGFLTFGFTQTVCGKPPLRFRQGTIQNGSVIIGGYDYDLSRFNHPTAPPTFPNSSINPLFQGGFDVAGKDISFMFQNVNSRCAGFFSLAANSSISKNSLNQPEWAFPCNVFTGPTSSHSNFTNYGSDFQCHTQSSSRQALAQHRPQGQVYYTWDDVKDPTRNLAVYESNILDLNLLQWLDRVEINYPTEFDDLKKGNGTYNGRDITMFIYRAKKQNLAACLQDIVTVGFIDTNTIGCVASQVVLYVSLIFIVGIVAIKFCMAVFFGWFLSWQLGAYKNESYQQRMRRAAEIEQWTDDIYRPAPSRYRPSVQKNGLQTGGKGNKRQTASFLPVTSRFTNTTAQRPGTTYGTPDPLQYKRHNTQSTYGTPGNRNTHLGFPDVAGFRNSRSSTTLDSKNNSDPSLATCPFPLHNVVPQPSADWEPYHFPLMHTICLVTAYSESLEGLRTTLDSLATSDYPNSHKLIMVIADGMVKGSGNKLTTPEIVLSMMKDLVVPVEECEAHSYVAIADGHKRHNMAKVFAGFYNYDDNTVELSKQQRVPIVLVAKIGNPLEVTDPKPGNRGKRDSQIVLMAFLQKVMFDERMTTFEYEFFNSIWRVSGISPDRYELVLCVDADTKIFPDSLTRMCACMSHDPEIMGLCGETKIANKAETWVTMIQVFEYYISHHLTKAFESMFGGVTCLPGCFSMYRIKSPKGDSGFWVPVLANPDIVEHYSENVVDTLHKKNLLLLGEDRYLTTLMLKTFPKRKLLFCPQAVCKTVVPDTFGVLISQRRRWINSTIHNLAELLLVRDLCGTFCFSMQFVIFVELAGTLVLPAAISFTIYLIIISIIPHQTSTVIPLVLLGIILGLPGLLIVVTSRKIAYVGWMLIYLLSLPIWNFVLPAYAFWHFDDFSWGQTRKVIGEKEGGHGDKEGEFDSSHIVMKRWAEFERDRRWKTGVQSRDSNSYDPRSDSKRYSLVSSETHHASSQSAASPFDSADFSNPPRPRYDSAPLLTLPAPLAVSTTHSPQQASPGTSVSHLSRTSEDVHTDYDGTQRLIASPVASDSPHQEDPYSEHRSPPGFQSFTPIENRLARNPQAGAVYRQGTVSSPYPGETVNPYSYSEPEIGGYGDAHHAESNLLLDHRARIQQPAPRNTRGISLVDSGPIPSGDGVRRLSRPGGRRPTSQVQTAGSNRYSQSAASSQATSPIVTSPTTMPTLHLPPGAAPPRPVSGQYDY